MLCLREIRGKRFLDENMNSKWSNLCCPLGMPRRCRTEDDDIRLSLLKALSVVSEDLFLFEFKILARRKHSLRVLVRYPNNLGIRMLINHS